MEKFKNALKSVNKFGLLALVLVAFATLAFKAPAKDTDVLYKRDNLTGAWSPVTTSNYFCNGSTNSCTKLYEEGKNPIDNPTEFIEEERGVYTPL